MSVPSGTGALAGTGDDAGDHAGAADGEGGQPLVGDGGVDERPGQAVVAGEDPGDAARGVLVPAERVGVARGSLGRCCAERDTREGCDADGGCLGAQR